jgi:Domain of unknown function (DUF5666)
MNRTTSSTIFMLLALWAVSARGADTDAHACRFSPGQVSSPSDALSRLVSRANTTAASQTEQRGLGGTGVVARAEERGLGGTGIVGVLRGFASICVNGYEVQIQPATEISVEGLPATQADLRLGQLLTVEAYVDGGRLVARHVSIEIAVAGPIQSIDTATGELVVAGQTIAADSFGDSANISGLQKGDWVAVSGLRKTDDTIVGSSIVRLAPGRQVFVSGMLREASNGTAQIGALTILDAHAEPGQPLAVRGTLEPANRLLASDVNALSGQVFSAPMAHISVEAYGTNIDAALARAGVSGQSITPRDTSAATQVDGAVVESTFSVTHVAPVTPAVDGAIPMTLPAPIGASANPSSSRIPESAPATGQSTTPSTNGATQSTTGARTPSSPPDGSTRTIPKPSTPPVDGGLQPDRSGRPDRPAPSDRPASPDRPTPPDRPARPVPPQVLRPGS